MRRNKFGCCQHKNGISNNESVIILLWDFTVSQKHSPVEICLVHTKCQVLGIQVIVQALSTATNNQPVTVHFDVYNVSGGPNRNKMTVQRLWRMNRSSKGRWSGRERGSEFRAKNTVHTVTWRSETAWKVSENSSWMVRAHEMKDRSGKKWSKNALFITNR